MDQMEIQSALAAARQARGAGRRDEAARLLHDVIARGGEQPAALNMLGMHAIGDGRIAEAAGLFRRAIAADPVSPDLQDEPGQGFARGRRRSGRKGGAGCGACDRPKAFHGPGPACRAARTYRRSCRAPPSAGPACWPCRPCWRSVRRRSRPCWNMRATVSPAPARASPSLSRPAWPTRGMRSRPRIGAASMPASITASAVVRFTPINAPGCISHSCRPRNISNAAISLGWKSSRARPT